MTDSTSDNVIRLGGGGLLYEDARNQAADNAREIIEEARRAEMMAPDPPAWADKPEPEPEKKPEKPAMTLGKIEAPKQPKPPFDRREAVSTALELAGIGLLVTTGFLITVWLGTLIAGLALVVLGVATSRNIGG
jgi:hypothetical protein